MHLKVKIKINHLKILFRHIMCLWLLILQTLKNISKNLILLIDREVFNVLRVVKSKIM